MKINNKNYTSIWYDETQQKVFYIDQTKLPWEFVIKEMKTVDDAVRAIVEMEVRGAPLIGVAAGFGFWVGCMSYAESYARSDAGVTPGRGTVPVSVKMGIYTKLLDTRPTAVNLKWALDSMMTQDAGPSLLKKALEIWESEIGRSRRIGEFGVELIKDRYDKTGQAVNILTHCNAGWLATVDYGTATAPIYLAHDAGIPVHVWVDETRPRNQGARLTAWELSQHGVPCTVIADNTGGHLMQNGQVDMVIVGTDRVAANGDVANKIGTYLKALAAHDNDIPFYVAMPWSSFDEETMSGKDIPIEERHGEEVSVVEGMELRQQAPAQGRSRQDGISAPLRGNKELRKSIGEVRCRIIPEGIPVANYSFDVTPAKYITAYITETGIKTHKSPFPNPNSPIK